MSACHRPQDQGEHCLSGWSATPRPDRVRRGSGRDRATLREHRRVPGASTVGGDAPGGTTMRKDPDMPGTSRSWRVPDIASWRPRPASVSRGPGFFVRALPVSAV